MAKKYNPEARDGDGDGLIQDGTERERPIPRPEELDTALESAETVVETTKPFPKVNTYIVASGDSYASLAARFCPPGTRKHDFAKALAAKNKNAVLRPGLSIEL